MDALIFASGFGAPPHSWTMSPLFQHAHEHGFQPFLHMGPMYGPIDLSARMLEDLVVTVRKDHDRVAVVGHSMGGLIAEKAGLTADVDAIVTIDTPHQGSSSAALLGLAALDMLPNSQWLRNLASAEGDRPSLLAIACSQSGVVPVSSATPSRQHRLIVANGPTHLTAPFDEDIADSIFRWLDDERA